MITFKDFLSESLKNPISEEELPLILKDYSDALSNFKEGYIIYKGFSEDISTMVFSPQEGLRRSAFTSNIYTLLIDNSSEWKSFPKRSKSAICSTNKKDAEGFGEAYIVLPKNGAKLAVAPERDFWFSFQKLETIGLDLESFNTAMNKLIPSIKDDTHQNVINALKTFDRQMEGRNLKEYIKGLDSYAKRLLEGIANEGYKGRDIYDYIMDLLSAEDFKILTAKDKIEGRHEIWFSNDCLILEENVLNKYLK